jgi:hypothetical protein
MPEEYVPLLVHHSVPMAHVPLSGIAVTVVRAPASPLRSVWSSPGPRGAGLARLAGSVIEFQTRCGRSAPGRSFSFVPHDARRVLPLEDRPPQLAIDLAAEISAADEADVEA